MKNTVIIALLDKQWPPQHSFIDGMLSDVVSREPFYQVRLCVSRSGHNDINPRRYRKSACIPHLYPRRKAGRLFNLWAAISLIYHQSNKERGRGNRVVLFVRNDPVLLLAASLMRSHVDKLVFQSSFPHEEYSGNIVKRVLAKFLYRLAGKNVDAVTGVSPEGVARTLRLCPSARKGIQIPLLSDLPLYCSMSRDKASKSHAPCFLYIGTHAKERQLETLLEAISVAIAKGAVAVFRFVGSGVADEKRLSEVQGVKGFIDRGVVKFERPVPRNEIPKILSECDVGLSLIPPKKIYYESSPTKLAEYMGSGLAVLANRGIPMQEIFVEDSGGGVLTEWTVESISNAIVLMSSSPEALLLYKKKSKEYAEKHLNYDNYLPCFLSLIHS